MGRLRGTKFYIGVDAELGIPAFIARQFPVVEERRDGLCQCGVWPQPDEQLFNGDIESSEIAQHQDALCYRKAALFCAVAAA